MTLPSMSGFTQRRGGGAPQKGLFVDGVWHCDCNPRNPANHFEVKKVGPNKGRWFRTCQKQQNDKSRCKFFLWDSDAHPREAAVLANNTRTEPSRANSKTPSKRPASPPPPYTVGSECGESSRKRVQATIVDLDNDYDFDAADDAFRDELNHAMTAVETPRKAVKTHEFATPSTRRTLPWNQDHEIAAKASELQTPQTSQTARVGSFSSRLGGSLFTPSRSVDETHRIATPSSSPYDAPTPSRFKDVGGDDLIHGVLGLLQDANVKLGSATESDLTKLLSKHAETTEGLRRGRDVTRTIVKARDAKITELTYRISTLEAELEVERTMVKHLQWESRAVEYSTP